jgi:CO/xanthine dehydrogenase Mo-binding subunit
MERHMDRIANAVGLSAVEIRKRNFLRPGQTTITEQVIRENIDLSQLLDNALAASNYHEKKKQFAKSNTTGSIRKGIGIATILHGAGFTGSGERYLNSQVGVEGTADGKVRVLVSSAEFGQGTNTVLCQIAAEALGIPYEFVSIARPDTSVVPNSGPTVASRTAMVIGNLVRSASIGLLRTLRATGSLRQHFTAAEFVKACSTYVAENGALRSLTRYQSPENIFWDDVKYKGEAYASFAWAAYVAEVSVDLHTYSARVENFVAAQEIGRVLHPILASGQILGGVAQGIGFALYEKVLWQNGRMANGQMTNYIMPASCDLPPIQVLFEEIGNPHGAFGAKGIGELPMDAPAPAIINAMVDGLGQTFDFIPVTAEDIFEALTSRQNSQIESAPSGARH